MKAGMTAIIAFVVCSAVAAQAQAQEVWTGYTKITNLYPDASGMAFNTVYANTSLSICDAGRRWAFRSDQANYQTLTATLIAAFMAGKQVNLNIAAASPTCAPIVNRFIVLE